LGYGGEYEFELAKLSHGIDLMGTTLAITNGSFFPVGSYDHDPSFRGIDPWLLPVPTSDTLPKTLMTVYESGSWKPAPLIFDCFEP
jgi:hypothetical protein